VNRAPVHACIAYSMHYRERLSFFFDGPSLGSVFSRWQFPFQRDIFLTSNPENDFPVSAISCKRSMGKTDCQMSPHGQHVKNSFPFFFTTNAHFLKHSNFFSRPPGLQESRRDILLVFLNSHFHWTLKFTIMTFQMHWIVSVSSRWQSPFQRDDAFLEKRFPCHYFFLLGNLFNEPLLWVRQTNKIAICILSPRDCGSLSVLFYR
jgi:hypothetical protein